MSKIKDPYPITDVYHIANTLVDGATVTVTDLCENLSNSFQTDSYDIENEIKKIDTKKYDKLDREIEIGEFGYYDRTWNNSSIASILEKRKKEKNETAN